MKNSFQPSLIGIIMVTVLLFGVIAIAQKRGPPRKEPPCKEDYFKRNGSCNMEDCRRNDPVSALEYCSWVRPLNQIRHGGDLFWMLTHILATSPQTRDRARNLLVLFISANPELPPSVTVKHLLDSAQRFDLGLDPHGFNYLLNAYTRNKRIDDALECFSLMVDRKVVPFVCYVNSLLSSLVKSNEIGEAKEIYNEMVEMGISGDNVTAQLLMRGCLRERRPEEAVRIFRRSSRDGLMYSLAVQAACKIPDLGMALGLLGEMREELGVCGSQETYTSVVVAFVKEGKVEEAVRVKEEMVGLGIPVGVIAATSLVTGYCKEWEFGKALDFFDEMEGMDKVIFSVMIEWLCREDMMVKAVEVFKRMRAVGITPSNLIQTSHTYDTIEP
ncbi:Pentatricopeptide repeat-containing protein [Raphanus sativus]|nr:Pentatricopeptide repeat-containing protein [Raphanus sativus]